MTLVTESDRAADTTAPQQSPARGYAKPQIVTVGDIDGLTKGSGSHFSDTGAGMQD